MTKKAVNEPSLALRALVVFLNLPARDVLEEPRPRNLEIELGWLYYSTPENPQQFLDLQQALKSRIVSLLKPASPKDALFSVLKAIGENNPRTAYRKIISLKEAQKSAEPFSVIDVAGQELAVIESQYDLWQTLDLALRDGSFSRVKHCPVCQKFFLASNRNEIYCSGRCRYLRRRPYFLKQMKERRADAKKAKRKKPQGRQKAGKQSPAQFLKALIQAEESDRHGKLLPIYKRLGGPLTGRKFITKLKGQTWSSLDAATREKITELQKERLSV